MRSGVRVGVAAALLVAGCGSSSGGVSGQPVSEAEATQWWQNVYEGSACDETGCMTHRLLDDYRDATTQDWCYTARGYVWYQDGVTPSKDLGVQTWCYTLTRNPDAGQVGAVGNGRQVTSDAQSSAMPSSTCPPVPAKC